MYGGGNPLYNMPWEVSCIAQHKNNFFLNLIWIHIYWNFWSVHANQLSKRQRAWSASRVCLFSQDFIEGWPAHASDYVFRKVAWLHWAWVGISASTPPPPTGSSCTYAHLLADKEHGEASKDEHGNIYYMLAIVACNDSTALGGRGYLVAPPPPIHWVMHAWDHLPTHYSITILNFKHILKLLPMVTSSDLCLCTQLAIYISSQV
jgi:hypothetical protein